MTTQVETTAEALERLIHQFADPLSFFRELIQNSIDAGTPEIDVDFEYEDGVMTIRVDDYGEGMDREIIDTRLTRLFSSGKEHDYTKIGRFGIGFVSVFAIDPDAVVVDTSRGGESWRILFKKDRTFERIALDLPVDGTKVRILKSVGKEEYAALRDRSVEVVAFWCRHVKPEVRVDGEVINQPLDVDSPCKLRYSEEGTEIVVGYAARAEPTNGYYNRGITLLEEDAESLVSFKIDSRYLEHTLTRDNVLRDENYEKAMAKLQELVATALPAHLFKELERTREAELWRLATNQLREWGGPSGQGWNVVADVALLETHGGKTLTPAQALRLRRAGKLYTATTASPVAEALVQRGDRVIACGEDGLETEFLAAFMDTPPEADKTFCRPTAVQRTTAAHERLVASFFELLRQHGAKVQEVRFGHLAYEGSPVADRVAITQGGFGELTPVEEACELATGFLDKKRIVVINADHPTVASLLSLAPREPEFAAYVAAKLLFLRRELTPELDTRLANLALDARCRRLAG